MINKRLENVTNIFQSFINLVNEYFTEKTLSVDGRMISKFSSEDSFLCIQKRAMVIRYGFRVGARTTVPYSVNTARNFISFYSQGESISVFRTNTKYTSSVT